MRYSLAVSGKPGGKKAGFWQVSAAACAAFLSFCSSMLVARVLGPGAFGSYTFVLWLATIMIPAIGIGTSTLSSRQIAEVQSREAPRLAAGAFYFIWKRQYSRILLYCLVYLLLIFPCSWFFGANAPLLLLLLAGLSAPPLLLSGIAGSTLRGLRRFDLMAAIRLFGILTTLLMILIAIQVPGERITLLLITSAISSVLMLIVALVCITRLLPMRYALTPGPFLKDRLTQGQNNSFLLFLFDAVVWQSGELILLAHWRSAVEVGFYALSSLLCVYAMDIPPVLLSTCILPLLLRYVPGQHYTSAGDAFVKTTLYMALLSILLCAAMLLLCPLVLGYCFGSAYLPIVTPLHILLIASAFGSISTVSLTHLAHREHRRTQAWLGLIATASLAVLAVPFISLWGITGAALACAIARVVSATGSILICKRMMHE